MSGRGRRGEDELYGARQQTGIEKLRRMRSEHLHPDHVAGRRKVARQQAPHTRSVPEVQHHEVGPADPGRGGFDAAAPQHLGALPPQLEHEGHVFAELEGEDAVANMRMAGADNVTSATSDRAGPPGPSAERICSSSMDTPAALADISERPRPSPEAPVPSRARRPSHCLHARPGRKPIVGTAYTLRQSDAGNPAEPAQPIGAHELLRRAVRLGEVVDDTAPEADNAADETRKIEDGDALARSHIDMPWSE